MRVREFGCAWRILGARGEIGCARENCGRVIRCDIECFLFASAWHIYAAAIYSVLTTLLCSTLPWSALLCPDLLYNQAGLTFLATTHSSMALTLRSFRRPFASARPVANCVWVRVEQTRAE